MEQVFQYEITLKPADFDENGNWKLSGALESVQQAVTAHCVSLGMDWDSMAAKGLFWVVLRHRMVLYHPVQAGQTLTVKTWPLPATRAAYPRAVEALDQDGNVVLRLMSLWVLMDLHTRTMVLPSRSGVLVPGVHQEDELPVPQALPAHTGENHLLWTVSDGDLDINGHVNNVRYLDHCEFLAGDYAASHKVKQLQICYLAEVLPHQEITLHYTLCDGILTVDGTRPRAEDAALTERVFSVSIEYI